MEGDEEGGDNEQPLVYPPPNISLNRDNSQAIPINMLSPYQYSFNVMADSPKYEPFEESIIDPPPSVECLTPASPRNEFGEQFRAPDPPPSPVPSIECLTPAYGTISVFRVPPPRSPGSVLLNKTSETAENSPGTPETVLLSDSDDEEIEVVLESSKTRSNCATQTETERDNFRN